MLIIKNIYNSVLYKYNLVACSVFFGNLAWNTDEKSLTEFISKIGINCLSVEIKRHDDTMRSKGWGLAIFQDQVIAEKAIKELNSTELNGRIIHVRVDRIHSDISKDLIQIFIGNVPWVCQSNDLMILFKDFKPIECNILTNMYGKSRGFAIMKFQQDQEATQAIEAMNNVEVYSRKIECRYDRGSDREDVQSSAGSVFVNKLDKSIDDNELATLFSHIGAIQLCQVSKSPDKKTKRWGIIKFQDPNHAVIAVNTMNGAVHGPKNIPLSVRLDRK